MHSKNPKRIIILDHNRGRLANQLWNFMSIYAYCLEKGYALENYSFFDEVDSFTIPPPRNLFIRFCFFGLLARKKWYRRWRPYDRYISFMKTAHSQQIVASGTEHP